MRLKPFFSFYGAKYRLAPLYPPPKYDYVVEPFAGSAQYATMYFDHNVRLYEKDPIIFGVWDFLIKASPNDIRLLPDVVESVDQLTCCQEAKSLIGFWLNHASASPKKTMSKWGRDPKKAKDFWGKNKIEMLLGQVEKIKHWQVFNKGYEQADIGVATYFIDPPYQDKGKFYRYGCGGINFPALGSWVMGLSGQAIVCENMGADWLPFTPLKSIHGARKRNMEAVFLKEMP